MKFLEMYLQTIKKRGNVELADSIDHTAEDISNRYLKNFSFTDHITGLLFGNVQSGKTGQIFGIISKAADLGFPVFLFLTTDNVALQQQTLNRVQSDMKGFCICGENDSKLFDENRLIDPVIIVLKKNSRILKLWSNIILSTGFMKGNPLFIIDDEADASSLNTKVNQGEISSINKYLDEIKNSASSSIYMQVTGTPQALLLQTIRSGWHPGFTYYFRPGNGYLGGDFFFPQTCEKPSCVNYLEDSHDSLLEMLVYHIAVSSIIFLDGGKAANALIHPSSRQAVHAQFSKIIKDKIAWCKEHADDEFSEKLRGIIEQLNPYKYHKSNLSDITDEAIRLVKEAKINVLVMNGRNDVEESEYASGSNIIIGGNSLGRGITFPVLQTVYYSRTSKNPQADTMWQHSRMFGYDRDPGLMNLFIDKRLYKLFTDINSANNSIISQIENGIQNVSIYYSGGILPTRKNVLDKSLVFKLIGGTNYFPAHIEKQSIDQISSLLKPFESEEPFYQVNLKLIAEIFKYIETSADFNKKSIIDALNSIISNNPRSQGILLVRRNRDVAEGTGALLSPNDWNLGKKFKDLVVLTMYQVTGNKGWNGEKLWVPNIKLPDEFVYYDVMD